LISKSFWVFDHTVNQMLQTGAFTPQSLYILPVRIHQRTLLVGKYRSKSKTGEDQLGLKLYFYETILKENKVQYSAECQYVRERQRCVLIKNWIHSDTEDNRESKGVVQCFYRTSRMMPNYQHYLMFLVKHFKCLQPVVNNCAVRSYKQIIYRFWTCNRFCCQKRSSHMPYFATQIEILLTLGLGMKPHLHLSSFGLIISNVIYGMCSILNNDIYLKHMKAVRRAIQTFSDPSTCIW
jgi:hypothetical protein